MDELLASVRRSQGNAVLELTRQLVEIPSVSGNEQAIMEFVADFLGKRGVVVQVLARSPDRPNVLATVGNRAGPRVVMNGHLDTVPPAAPTQWRNDPFGALQEGTKLVGLGTLDMKGSVAAMMLTLLALKAHEDQLQGSVQLQIVSDEEDSGYFGTPFLAELIEQGRLERPDHVIVGEFTGLQVMTAERGSFKIHIHFRGRATHTATARVDGRNAIVAAAEAIRVIERDLDIYHPDVGQAVISVNQIRGGAFFSQVPDECTIQVDRRMIPGETMESVMEELRVEIESVRPRFPWLDFEVTPCLDGNGFPRYAAPNVTRRDSPVADAVRRAHERVTGQKARDFHGWFGATDARCYRYAGIDSINYGPVGEFAHGPNEYVELESLDVMQAVLATAVAELLAWEIAP